MLFFVHVFDCMFEFHYHIGMHVANTRTLFPHLLPFSRKLIKSTTAYYSAALSVLTRTFDIFIDTRYPYRAKVIYSYCCRCCAIVVSILFFPLIPVSSSHLSLKFYFLLYSFWKFQSQISKSMLCAFVLAQKR